jgi:hypothetical protein
MSNLTNFLNENVDASLNSAAEVLNFIKKRVAVNGNPESILLEIYDALDEFMNSAPYPPILADKGELDASLEEDKLYELEEDLRGKGIDIIDIGTKDGLYGGKVRVAVRGAFDSGAVNIIDQAANHFLGYKVDGTEDNGTTYKVFLAPIIY